MTRRPNVLLIITDQQSARAMSASGNPYLRTPNMDLLAAGGVRFERCYCTSPVCGPARVSLNTGRMPHAVGVNVNSDIPDLSIPNLGHLFQEAGYDTVWAGKWGMLRGHPKGPDGTPGFLNLPVAETDARYGTYIDEAVSDAAVAFLQQRGGNDKPFLLSVSLTNPHDICYWVMNHPLQANVKSAAPLPPLPGEFAIDPAEPEFVGWCRERDHYGDENTYTRDWDEARWRQYLYHYYRFTEQVDGCIGRILATLETKGLAENTLVALTSDHGEGMAAHHWVVKLMFWESVANVPFILRWPGVIRAGSVVSSHLASSQDLLPTLCGYAGIAAPAGVTGIDLRPSLDDPSLPGEECVISELQPDPERPELKGRMVVDLRYKYMAFSHGARPEMLFDLISDPGETHNLVGQPAYADELMRMRRLLADWVAHSGDAFRLPGA